MIITLNIQAAWIGFLLGVVSGALQGLLFHKEDWLGGYGSWPRRMMRLGHISFFGLGFINLAFGLSVHALDIADAPMLGYASLAFIIGAITMPLFCYLSAFRKFFRHGFFIPVLAILTGMVAFLTILLPL